MPRDLKSYRIFIASPGGLEAERKAFSDVVEEFNISCAQQRQVSFEPVGWEITLAGMGRPQERINEDVRSCDYFVMVLHDRWGQPTATGPDPKYKSGTHEEYCVALESYEDSDRPMRQLVLLFKAVDPSKLADPGPQLQQVLEFRRELEREKKLLFSTFDETRLFENVLRRQLDQWLFAHEEGFASEKFGPQQFPTPSPNLSGEPSSNEFDSETSPTSQLLSEAEKLADTGFLVDAEAKYAEAIVTGNDPEALNCYGKFLVVVGRLDQAAVMFRRIAELGQLSNDMGLVAFSDASLGNICLRRGEFDKAEELYRSALAIHQKLGLNWGVAGDYRGLGWCCQQKGEIDRAEELYRDALAIDTEIGYKDGQARDFAYLGGLYRRRGEFDISAEMTRKAIAIHKSLGKKSSVARALCELGNTYRRRGDLERAEKIYYEARSIFEEIGWKEGSAYLMGNLGLLHKARGDATAARECFTRSRDMYAQLGLTYFLETTQKWIDRLPADRIDTD